MEPTYTPNGDVELGDYHARMSDDWVNIGWIITKYCNLGCPYCVGFSLKGQYPKSLLDTASLEALAEKFARISSDNERHVYLTISGGEPTYVPKLPALAGELTKRGVTVELHTNFTLKPQVQAFMDAADPQFVGQIMATYHRWSHKSRPELADIYFSLFHEATERGFMPVCKVMVMPGKVRHFFEVEEPFLREHLPQGALILPWAYIAFSPKSQQDYGRAYPYKYAPLEHALLDRNTVVRAGSQKWYRRGAGWHYEMGCGAGDGFIFMNEDGSAWRCFGHGSTGGNSIGNLDDGVFLARGPQPCPYRYCGTPYWALWFGENPWDYIPGARKEDFYFCKYGPGRVKK